MEYIHIKSGNLYKFVKSALFQNERGKWVKSIIYENNEGMTFVRLQEDFEKSFEFLNFDNKIKIWLHYVVKQCYLNAWLKIEQKSSLKEFKIQDFDTFCSGENLKEYYWRFSKEINLW